MGCLSFSLAVFPMKFSCLIRNFVNAEHWFRRDQSTQSEKAHCSTVIIIYLGCVSFSDILNVLLLTFYYSFIIEILLGILWFRTWKGYSLKRGPNYAPKRKKVVTDLTRDNFQRYFLHKLNVNGIITSV